MSKREEDQLLEETDRLTEEFKKFKGYTEESRLIAKTLPPRKAIQFLRKRGQVLGKQINKFRKSKEKLGERIDQLQTLIDSMDGLESKGGDPSYFNTGEKMSFSVNGIWIVSEKTDTDVTITKFSELIRNEPKPWKMTLKGILQNKNFDSDGVPIDFSLGALFILSNQDLEVGHKGIGIHMANVGPSGEKAQLQYEYALFKLGLGMKPSKEIPTIVIDGQFRQALIDKSKESN